MYRRPAGPAQLFSLVADGARCDLRLAGRLAAFRRLAPVNAAGKPVDQPDIVLGRTFQPDKSRAHCRHQRGQQDGSGNDGRADQYGYRDTQISRRDGTLPLILVSFRCLEKGQLTTLALVWTRLKHDSDPNGLAGAKCEPVFRKDQHESAAWVQAESDRASSPFLETHLADFLAAGRAPTQASSSRAPTTSKSRPSHESEPFPCRLARADQSDQNHIRPNRTRHMSGPPNAIKRNSLGIAQRRFCSGWGEVAQIQFWKIISRSKFSMEVPTDAAEIGNMTAKAADAAATKAHSDQRGLFPRLNR